MNYITENSQKYERQFQNIAHFNKSFKQRCSYNTLNLLSTFNLRFKIFIYTSAPVDLKFYTFLDYIISEFNSHKIANLQILVKIFLVFDELIRLSISSLHE